MADNIDIEKIATLAKLKLTKEEIPLLEQKFSSILQYFNLLSEADIHTDLLEKDESLLTIFREDQPSKSDVKIEDFSPYIENNFFKVPKIIE